MDKRKGLCRGVAFAFALMLALSSAASHTTLAAEPVLGEVESESESKFQAESESESESESQTGSESESESESQTESESESESESQTESESESESESQTESESESESEFQPEEEFISITKAEELAAIAEKADGKFILMNDIDLSQTAWTSIATFSGELNGNGHAVKGLKAPLFAALTAGSIWDLTLSDVDIQASGSTGALAQTLTAGKGETCSIKNVKVTGQVTGAQSTGGLFGTVNVADGRAEIAGCVNMANVSGTTEVGGIAGKLVCAGGEEGLAAVTGTANAGIVKGTGKAGGLFGSLSLEDSSVGLDARVSVTESYNVGAVDCANTYTGGIAGFLQVSGIGAAEGAVKLENCYNLGTMSDGGNIAGGAGMASGSIAISKCVGVQVYNSRTYGIIGTSANLAGDTEGNCILSDCYYFSANGAYAYMTGSRVSGTAVALDETQIKTAASYANFDFTNVWAVEANVNGGYPHLKHVAVMEASYTAPAAGTTLTDSGSAAIYEVVKPGCEVSYEGTTNPSAKTVTIPSEVSIGGYTYRVTEIGIKAFYNNKTVTAVTVPATVKTIRKGAFYGCSSLKKVGGTAGVERILVNAFRGCTSLTTVGGTPNRVTLRSVTSLGARAFMNCTAIRRVYISSTGLTSIGMGAFRNCKSMTRITTFSTEISKIGQYAFYKDVNLKMVILRTEKLAGSHVGYKAFTATYPRARFKVPASKKEEYKAIFKSKGAGEKIIVNAV